MTSATVQAQPVQKVSFWYHFKQWALTFLKYLSLIFVTFWMLLPLVTCFFTAAKDTKEWQSTSVMALPKNFFNFSNYVEAFKLSNMGVAFRNSLIVLVAVCFLTTIIGTQLAYVLSRFTFPGNAVIRTAFLLASLLPGIAMQVAVYKIMGTFHLINSLWGYIIMSMGTDVISIYIFIQYFENISISLDEAALMDGASYFTIYSCILLPLLKPAIVTCLILKGVGIYNEYYAANLYLQDKQRIGTVAISLYAFTGPQGSKYNLICAGVIITLLPALIAFLLFQKQIYNGVAAGAVKE
ncbi:ABC transporter, permease protein [Bifidobacterium sp. DSM 109960]|uniref:ABC transporter, permease protein n=1 Tax=Bifidobacterium erythrocebi TaxID=2675325 RepID=A0A7Y0HU60_9BIFI|nr:carbohydrate ABC transporter permease [Bifidobacterium sp. DSM 109960]NMM95313.1 ABC transporter, permease protein [Bifidobacterium sp. DSM 109960]